MATYTSTNNQNEYTCLLSSIYSVLDIWRTHLQEYTSDSCLAQDREKCIHLMILRIRFRLRTMIRRALDCRRNTRDLLSSSRCNLRALVVVLLVLFQRLPLGNLVGIVHNLD